MCGGVYRQRPRTGRARGGEAVARQTIIHGRERSGVAVDHDHGSAQVRIMMAKQASGRSMSGALHVMTRRTLPGTCRYESDGPFNWR